MEDYWDYTSSLERLVYAILGGNVRPARPMLYSAS